MDPKLFREEIWTPSVTLNRNKAYLSLDWVDDKVSRKPAYLITATGLP